jgi:hypothetical protein
MSSHFYAQHRRRPCTPWRSADTFSLGKKTYPCPNTGDPIFNHGVFMADYCWFHYQRAASLHMGTIQIEVVVIQESLPSRDLSFVPQSVCMYLESPAGKIVAFQALVVCASNHF